MASVLDLVDDGSDLHVRCAPPVRSHLRPV